MKMCLHCVLYCSAYWDSYTKCACTVSFIALRTGTATQNVPVLCPLLHCVLGQLHKMCLYCVLYCIAYWDSYTKCACTVSFIALRTGTATQNVPTLCPLLQCVLGQLHKMCLYCVLYCIAYWDSYTKCVYTVSFIALPTGTATQNAPALCPLLYCALGQLHKMRLYCVLY